MNFTHIIYVPLVSSEIIVSISDILRIRAMQEANTALLDILVDNSVIIPSF